MPRHFLVKRHKHCGGALSYRDRLQDGTGKGDYNALDSDSLNIIREGDYVSDYSGYGSPDSGYAASPNSFHMGFAREKENIVTDRENNNNKNYIKAASVIGYYDNDHINMTTTGAIDSGNYGNNGENCSLEDEADDAPIDLSMSGRKKAILSSVPAYMQQEEIHHQNLQKFHYQQQQQQQGYTRQPSPSHPSTTAAAMRFDAFNKLYMNHSTSADSSLCAIMTPLSPTLLPYNTTKCRNLPHPDDFANSIYPLTIKEDTLLKLENEMSSSKQSIIVPQSAAVRRPSPMSPLSSPAPALDPGTNNGRSTPISRPSSIHSPSRKRGISDDNDEGSNEYYFQELSKSLPALKKRDNINESITTPVPKLASSQKARTAAPAAKKSPGSVPSGKKLKAVRRLNFDIDTTSPVSGTIIKDAADFHPEDGRVVYGDIEPSFNFVEVTPEARAELDKIENKIGDYICQLCKEFYDDAFQLAQHRCSRIIHVEYRCPECEKVFNCPANLASHRRWHKPRVNGQTKATATTGANKIFANQKIAPKPDCNSNISDSGPEQTLRVTSSPSTGASKTRNGNSDDVSNPENHAFSRSSNASRDSSRYSPAVDGSNNFIVSSNSESKENGCPSTINVAEQQTSPFSEEHTSKAQSTPNFLYRSSSIQDSLSRADSVIALNPLHITPSTYGSSLTSEERSLVLQVLSCHNRQHPTAVTTATTTVNTSHITDASADSFSSKAFHSETDPSDQDDLGHQDDCHDKSTSFKLSFLSSSGSPSSSPPPLDLTQAKHNTNTHQRPYQHHQHQTPIHEHQISPYIGCPVCGKRFQRQAYLRKHILNQHGKLTNPSTTDERTAEDTRATDNTIFSGNPTSGDSDDQRINSTVAKCSVCSKRFTSESARLKHESLTHGLTAVLSCSTCCMTFPSKAALDKHSRYAHATETFPCKYCSSTFHSSPGLTRHINKCHPTENRRVILLQLPASRIC